MAAPDGFVEATMHFLSRDQLYTYEKPYSIQYFPHGDVPQSNVKQDVVENVRLRDIRLAKNSLEFDKDGFVVRNFESRLSYDDFADPEKVKSVYLEEICALLQNTLGTNNVAIIEYLVRRRHATFPISTGQEFEYAQPVATAHIDFSPDCIVEMIQDRYAHRADDLLKYRYRIVNVWKPLHGPLQDWPLGLCRPSSLKPDEDLQLNDRVYSTNIEESIQVHYGEHQDWCYLKDQESSEVLIFRGGDSTVGLAAGVPHCSFQHPGDYSARRPRESIEVRAFVFDAEGDLDLQRVSVSRRHGPKSTYQLKRH